jgi:hypothetical protein
MAYLDFISLLPHFIFIFNIYNILIIWFNIKIGPNLNNTITAETIIFVSGTLLELLTPIGYSIRSTCELTKIALLTHYQSKAIQFLPITWQVWVMSSQYGSTLIK